MGAYEQMKRTLFANLKGFGIAEPLTLFKGTEKPVTCPLGYCSPPSEENQTDEKAEWEISNGVMVLPFEFGDRLQKGDRAKRQVPDDDRTFVITGIRSKSRVAVVFSIGIAEMDRLYGTGTRRMRGGGAR